MNRAQSPIDMQTIAKKYLIRLGIHSNKEIIYDSGPINIKEINIKTTIIAKLAIIHLLHRRHCHHTPHSPLHCNPRHHMDSIQYYTFHFHHPYVLL